MAETYKTIPVRPATWRRLTTYKMGSATFDRVLNELMNAVPVEEVAERTIREHYARLETFRGRSWRAVRAALKD